MSRFISGIFLVAFAAAGIVGLLREIWLWLLKTDCPETYYIVIPMSGHIDNAETMLRCAASRAGRFGNGKIRIICADCGMDEETELMCKNICEEKPEISICRISELGTMINRNS